jgi:hypothetical protein
MSTKTLLLQLKEKFKTGEKPTGPDFSLMIRALADETSYTLDVATTPTGPGFTISGTVATFADLPEPSGVDEQIWAVTDEDTVYRSGYNDRYPGSSWVNQDVEIARATIAPYIAGSNGENTVFIDDSRCPLDSDDTNRHDIQNNSRDVAYVTVLQPEFFPLAPSQTDINGDELQPHNSFRKINFVPSRMAQLCYRVMAYEITGRNTIQFNGLTYYQFHYRQPITMIGWRDGADYFRWNVTEGPSDMFALYNEDFQYSDGWGNDSSISANGRIQRFTINQVQSQTLDSALNVSGSFTTTDGKTITITNGVVTSIV